MDVILSLGLVLLVGLISARLINRIKFPAVTAYLLLGILIGPSLANLIPPEIINASGIVSNVVLGLIAFSIGQNFSKGFFQKFGTSVLGISLLEGIGTWLLVTLGILIFVKLPFYVALLFGAISAATAPAATVMVIRESKAKGTFTDILLAVVAIDDAWCLIIFALSLAISKAIAFHTATEFFLFKVLFRSLVSIGGAFILGGMLAWLASTFSRYIRNQDELLIYTLSFILLTTGVAIWLHLSVLLANMFLGTVLVNIDRKSSKFFDILRRVDSPLYLVFFVLAGANLEINLLGKFALLSIVYILFRLMGKVGGSFFGGCMVKAGKNVRRYLGLGLAPQAGVALGCALIAKANFPQTGNMILTTIVATTIIYELIGPFCTRIALDKAGQIRGG